MQTGICVGVWGYHRPHMTVFLRRVAILTAACWAASGANACFGAENKPVVPGADWERVARPESIGYSSAKLEAVSSKNSNSLKRRDIVRLVSKTPCRRYEVISWRCNLVLRPVRAAESSAAIVLRFQWIGFLDHMGTSRRCVRLGTIVDERRGAEYSRYSGFVASGRYVR